MRPLLPFATLLGTAFLLGCQERASSPVEPEGPQFDRPDNTREEGDCDPGEVLNDKGHCHASDDAPDPPVGEDPLVTAGRILFFEETFDGNGRTCGTCHRADNNMALDVAFIATLDPINDPLFVADNICGPLGP